MAETTCDMNTKQMPEFQLNSPNSQNFSAECRERGERGTRRVCVPCRQKKEADRAAPVFAAGILVGNAVQSSLP